VQQNLPASSDVTSVALLGVVEAREDSGRVARQSVAGLGQLDRTRAALDQRQPDLLLQRGDVLAHGRLRQLQRVRRGGERSAGGDLCENLNRGTSASVELIDIGTLRLQLMAGAGTLAWHFPRRHLR
jgi:hypothetical protein